MNVDISCCASNSKTRDCRHSHVHDAAAVADHVAVDVPVAVPAAVAQPEAAAEAAVDALPFIVAPEAAAVHVAAAVAITPAAPSDGVVFAPVAGVADAPVVPETDVADTVVIDGPTAVAALDATIWA